MAYEVVARASSERGEVVLRRVNGVFVMDTAETTSETELARAALRVVDQASDVLVGGLGMGFTTREVLADPRVERLLVVEIEAAVIDWLRDGTVPHGPTYLADERLTVVNADIREAVAEARPDSLDLVLLDIDNGPDFLVYDANRSVYEEEFLGRVRDALHLGGALVVWSAAETDRLRHAMAAVFGNCEAIPHPVRLHTRDERYWLYLSRLGE